MTETHPPYPTYSDERLLQAREQVRARVLLAERNLERALAHEERAQAAAVSVRQHLARAKGDERLIEAILAERETIFEEEEKEGAACKQEGEPCTEVQRKYTPRSLISMEDGASRPEPSPAPLLTTSPGSLRERLFSRSAFR